MEGDTENDLKYMKVANVRKRWQFFLVGIVCVFGVFVLVASIACHIHCPRPLKPVIVTNENGKLVLLQQTPAPKLTIPPELCQNEGKRRKTCQTGIETSNTDTGDTADTGATMPPRRRKGDRHRKG